MEDRWMGYNSRGLQRQDSVRRRPMDRYCAGGRVLSGLMLLHVAVSLQGSRAASIEAPLAADPKPYRILLVVEHRSDPYGLVVSSEADKFQPVAALLKAWSVPFDILRLDQQHVDTSYLFDRSGDIRYGALIWLADLPSYKDQNTVSLEEAVHGGTGLLVAKSRFLDPGLEK